MSEKNLKVDKKQAQITAGKITMIFQFVGMLDETDIEYLKEVQKQMIAQSGTLRATQGILTDYEQMPYNRLHLTEKLHNPADTMAKAVEYLIENKLITV